MHPFLFLYIIIPLNSVPTTLCVKGSLTRCHAFSSSTSQYGCHISLSHRHTFCSTSSSLPHVLPKQRRTNTAVKIIGPVRSFPRTLLFHSFLTTGARSVTSSLTSSSLLPSSTSLIFLPPLLYAPFLLFSFFLFF
uniref:T. congolense-specific, cell surface-expressed gene family n=1 Tax=Trypanosoma congolense (strain IL3000) TaxID=1068625 RepID=G0USK9_TRYCI|nr:hypothetical protein, unlikely [Trypanosoma congolense IL3000]